jgi:hypothetical protein
VAPPPPYKDEKISTGLVEALRAAGALE